MSKSEVQERVRAGSSRSKLWAGAGAQDEVQGWSGWPLEAGHSPQQQFAIVAVGLAAQVDDGVQTPKARTAMRIATRLLKYLDTWERIASTPVGFKLRRESNF